MPLPYLYRRTNRIAEADIYLSTPERLPIFYSEMAIVASKTFRSYPSSTIRFPILSFGR